MLSDIQQRMLMSILTVFGSSDKCVLLTMLPEKSQIIVHMEPHTSGTFVSDEQKCGNRLIVKKVFNR